MQVSYSDGFTVIVHYSFTTIAKPVTAITTHRNNSLYDNMCVGVCVCKLEY